MSDRVHDLAAIMGCEATAKEVLSRTTLAHLASANLTELERFFPAPQAKLVHAALRLGRAAVYPACHKQPLDGPAAAFAHLYPHLAGLETEALVVACLNARHRPIFTEVVARGSTSSVTHRAADIFTPAVRHRAVAIILGHNHPSGSPEPSNQDRKLTDRIRQCGEILDLPLLDHLVVGGPNRYISLRDTYWPPLGQLEDR